MKPINCPIENQKKIKSYLRFVNKDDLSYVDMRISRGQDVFKLYWPLIKYADEICGRITVLSKEKSKKYHYCILFTIDENDSFLPNGGLPIGFFKHRGKMFSMNIDPFTNEMESAEEILTNNIVTPNLIEPFIAFRKEKNKWYKIKYQNRWNEDASQGKKEFVSKRIINYDKIFI